MKAPSLKTPPSKLSPEERKWLKESHDLFFVAIYCAKWEKQLRKDKP